MHASREGLYQRCIKIGKISKLAIFSVFVNMGPYLHMGEEKTVNVILPESAKQICSQTFMHTHRKGSLPKFHKELWNFTFWTLAKCLLLDRRFSKCYSYSYYESFPTKRLWVFSVTVHIKLASWNTPRSKCPIYTLPVNPKPKSKSVSLCIQPYFELQIILRQAYRMTSKWPWPLQGQGYPICLYDVLVRPSPKLFSISIYDWSLSSYRTLCNKRNKMTSKWPWTVQGQGTSYMLY